MTLPVGPRGLTQQAGQLLADPTDVRQGRVSAVTARGIDVAVAGGLVADAAHLDGYNPAVGDNVVMTRFADSWFVLGRPVGPGTATDNATRGTGVGATLLNGVVLSGGGATLASSTGAVVTVPRYNLNYHHPAGHWVMLWVGYSWYNNITNDVLFVTFKNSVTGATVGTDELIQAGGNAFGHWASAGYLVGPSEGGKEAKITMTIQRGAGTGTVRVDDAAVRRGYLIALDMADQTSLATV
jgi:hypothetical protein